MVLTPARQQDLPFTSAVVAQAVHRATRRGASRSPHATIIASFGRRAPDSSGRSGAAAARLRVLTGPPLTGEGAAAESRPAGTGAESLGPTANLNLASFWWKPGDRPWPSKQKLADALDVDASTVRRSIQKMEKKGYVKRIYKKAAVGDNLSNEYDLTGRVAAVGLLAAKELKAREKRAEEDSARKRTPKALEIIKGGKE